MLVFVSAQKLFQNIYLSSTFKFVAKEVHYHHRSLCTISQTKWYFQFLVRTILQALFLLT